MLAAGQAESGAIWQRFAEHYYLFRGTPTGAWLDHELHELFGVSTQDIRLERRLMLFRYPSPEAYIQYWRRYYGPTLKSFESVGEAGREAFETDLLDLIARFNRAEDGTMVVASEYLEAVIAR